VLRAKYTPSQTLFGNTTDIRLGVAVGDGVLIGRGEGRGGGGGGCCEDTGTYNDEKHLVMDCERTRTRTRNLIYTHGGQTKTQKLNKIGNETKRVANIKIVHTRMQT